MGTEQESLKSVTMNYCCIITTIQVTAIELLKKYKYKKNNSNNNNKNNVSSYIGKPVP
jgi:hypothetical protein